MTDTVTVRGFIATAPTQKTLPNSTTPVTNFRVASTPRWFDNTTGTWKEGTTNWYTVNSFRALAYNCARSLQVGQPVLVTGRLRVKQFERSDGSAGTSIEIDASSIGHDLNYGLAQFTRVSDRKPEVEDTDRRFNKQVQGADTREQTHPEHTGGQQDAAGGWEVPPQPQPGGNPARSDSSQTDVGLTSGADSKVDLSLTS